MSEEIRQIAERLVGLRDALDLRPEDIASTCNINLETYLGYESGEKDIPVSFLHQIAKHSLQQKHDQSVRIHTALPRFHAQIVR